jgi:hypothetical protein
LVSPFFFVEFQTKNRRAPRKARKKKRSGRVTIEGDSIQELHAKRDGGGMLLGDTEQAAERAKAGAEGGECGKRCRKQEKDPERGLARHRKEADGASVARAVVITLCDVGHDCRTPKEEE